YAGLAVFLAWGLSKPPLEREWELHHELKIGLVGKLAAKDHELLNAALLRHADLADALLSEGNIGVVSAHSQGWLETPQATIIRAASAPHPCELRLETRIPDELLPLRVKLRGEGWQHRLDIRNQGVTKYTLPKAPPGAEIITLEAKTKEREQDIVTLGIRVGFSCASAKRSEAHD